ncbi:GNAT family N-acetyltransferase [Brevibacillus agri]|uniref:GNAT family N-acetyltransferase n=1 Tax=Brevibacillus sp. NSP2.1 TaxID=3003229 RepID=UPI001C8EE6DA|nr:MULTISPECIES: GNAT family N-acetyltransferase [Brevibacillus]MBY0051634.1 GNAT family N-acetyltransferase [Brevibacillus agri]
MNRRTFALSHIRLRPTTADDLPTFYAQQLDPEANRMAAFTSKNPSDREAFAAHWNKLLADESIHKMTVLADEKIAGYIVHFEQFGHPSVGYWLGTEYWGKGIATTALQTFLQLIPARPVYARVAKDNVGSIRVLQKCGFQTVGEDKGFSAARGSEVEEFIMRREA